MLPTLLLLLVFWGYGLSFRDWGPGSLALPPIPQFSLFHVLQSPNFRCTQVWISLASCCVGTPWLSYECLH